MNILEFTKLYVLPVIDILAVAYILYKTYEIIVDTRAYLALKTFLLVLTIYAISIILKLDTLNHILKIVISYGVIAFIVVFQPEIRYVLTRVGERTFWAPHFKINFQPINEIINAVKFLSKRKIGALIVLKRKAGLKNIENTGIRIDAVVSAEIIISIFFKHNPLHDGAIIVENDRITAASCFLPLSDSPVVKKYGSRHKAAVGLSEETDAIIIVVSEETGTISIAQKGKLKSGFDESSLKNELNILLSEK